MLRPYILMIEDGSGKMRKGFDSRKPAHKDYRAFLDKVLKTIRCAKGNQKDVYQFLEANLDKLDNNLAQKLRSWAIAKLSEVEIREARRIAGNIGDFCNLIAQFPLIKPETKWEIAITGYKVVATIFTEASPKDWVMLQNNLGIVYRNQGRIDKAITVFEAALDFCSLEKFPNEWAMTQNNLGNAYYSRSQIQENKLQDLDLAIACYEQALRGTPKHKFPYEWAQTQQNLGGVYRKQGKTAEAITCYETVLQEVYTEETFERAQVQNNLGLAYSDLGQITEAIECFRFSLKILTPAAYPLDCLNTGRGFGYVAFKASRWTEAMEGYGIAIEAVEHSRLWSDTDAERQKFMEAEIDVYIGIVQACIRDGQLTKAIEYVERSKARNLVELLTTRNFYPKDVSQEVWDQLDRRRQEIRVEQMRIDRAEWKQKVPENRTHLNQLRQLLDEWITETIKPIDPSFILTQKVQGISFQEIQALLPDDKTALIEWYILDTTFVTFIVTGQSPGITVWESSPEDLQAFQDWGNEYLQDYNFFRPSQPDWKDKLESRLYRLAEILHLEELFTHVPDTCDKVILIPHLSLHLLPLHALPLPNQQDKCLLDKFPRGVGYAPSCQLLQLTQKRDRPDFSYFFGIQNPTQDLTYANLEVQIVRRFFEPAYVLVEKDAKKDVFSTIPYREHLRAAHCVHFSCHGKFNFKSPVKSALLLANEEPLTLEEIFGLDLSQCRLVTLSACETGIISPNGLSDQYIGLPSGFLYAGSPSVVSSLWTVSDLSTAFLMIKFYEYFSQCNPQEAGAVAVALNQAQKWLRNLTTEEFEKLLDKYNPQIEQIFAQIPIKKDRIKARRRLENLKRQSYPFASPFYWAAFTATGL